MDRVIGDDLLIGLVLRHLRGRDLGAAACVCRHWNETVARQRSCSFPQYFSVEQLVEQCPFPPAACVVFVAESVDQEEEGVDDFMSSVAHAVPRGTLVVGAVGADLLFVPKPVPSAERPTKQIQVIPRIPGISFHAEMLKTTKQAKAFTQRLGGAVAGVGFALGGIKSTSGALTSVVRELASQDVGLAVSGGVSLGNAYVYSESSQLSKDNGVAVLTMTCERPASDAAGSAGPTASGSDTQQAESDGSERKGSVSAGPATRLRTGALKPRPADCMASLPLKWNTGILEDLDSARAKSDMADIKTQHLTRPPVAFLFSCVGRLYGPEDFDVDVFRTTFPNTTVCGFFGMGEVLLNPGNTDCMNYQSCTMTVLQPAST